MVSRTVEAGHLQQLTDTYGELYDALHARIGQHRLNRLVSTDALVSLCDNLIDELIKLRDVPRRFPSFINAEPENELSTHSVATAPRAEPAAQSSITLNEGNAASAEMRKYGILRILGSETEPFSLDEVMSALTEMGLATEKQRGTVVSTLRRMRLDSGLVETPSEGHYRLTGQGRLAYSQMTQPLVRKPVK